MQLRDVPSGSTRWTEGMDFMRRHGYVDPSFRARGREHRLHLLEDGTGGTFDEVTEQVTGRPIVAAMLTSREMYTSSTFYLAVDPAHRRHRWGYRMMRWSLDNHHDALYGQVPVFDSGAMAFAAKYGLFDGVVLLGSGVYVANVRFSYTNENWMHAGCRCHHCLNELSSLTSGSSRPEYE